MNPETHAELIRLLQQAEKILAENKFQGMTLQAQRSDKAVIHISKALELIETLNFRRP